MFSLSRNNVAIVICLFSLIACSSSSKKEEVQASNEKSVFSICSEPNGLPMSDERSRSGFEIEVAKIIAEQMGKELQVKWIPQRDQSYIRETVGSGECQAIMG